MLTPKAAIGFDIRLDGGHGEDSAARSASGAVVGSSPPLSPAGHGDHDALVNHAGGNHGERIVSVASDLEYDVGGDDIGLGILARA